MTNMVGQKMEIENQLPDVKQENQPSEHLVKERESTQPAPGTFVANPATQPTQHANPTPASGLSIAQT